jgi:hypothetical protein
MWEDSLRFARKHNIHFTYFVSGVYFLPERLKTKYRAPGQQPGISPIGFGENNQAEMLMRLRYLNQAIDEGHEIGSHANGHFDGTNWSREEWGRELKQFHSILENTYKLNNLTAFEPSDWSDRVTSMTRGFRAPLLGTGDGLWAALEGLDYRYDTSDVRHADPAYWPRRENGHFWNFPLASIPIEGTGRKTLTMDYNLKVSKASEEQTLRSYLRYFINNYNGNRAPVDIGHHFADWNNSDYWYALRRFAEKVCHLPEVICGSYAELATFLEKQTPEQLKAYRSGNFEKAVPLPLSTLI